MKLLSSLLSMFGIGNRDFAPRVEPKPYIAPETIRPSKVFRGGKHRTRSQIECPVCWTTTSERGRCLNRRCSEFNGVLAFTHPDLTSLARPVRRYAQRVWARGGMAALRGLTAYSRPA